MSNVFRGTPEGARFFERLVEEMEYMAANGIGTLTDEKYRLSFIGVPCYPIFRRFNEMFTKWGGSFVMSSYLWFASGGTNIGVQYDLDDPFDSLAEGVLISVRDAMDSMFHPELTVLAQSDEFNVDGVVYHPIKSCRTTSTGMADNRRMLMEKSTLPSLFIESDMMDSRVVGEAQMKNRIDAFFEGLASRKARATVEGGG
jgi:benzoyl-CoA reductase subunit B